MRAGQKMLHSRWSEPTCDRCGHEITVALCHDVRLYDRGLDDGMRATTYTTRHWRLCDECSREVTEKLEEMMA